MPCFNQAQYIEESIQSILSQNYPKLEFIIFDGGSTDGSAQIIEKYSNYLAYWHSRPDKGQTDALIQGFSRATGDLMGWINSDDILLPNTLKYISLAYVKNLSVELFFGNFLLIDKDSKITRCQKVPSNGIKWFAERGHWIFNGTGTFFSRRAYDSVGGLHADLSYVMDADLYIRMILNGIQYQHIGHYISGFRRHSSAKTVFGSKLSKDEHYYAATKYWLPDASKGRKQKRWRYLYWAFQLVNGNFKMFFDTITAKGRNWKELAERVG